MVGVVIFVSGVLVGAIGLVLCGAILVAMHPKIHP